MKEYKFSFSIKKWSEDDRPREKLLLKGKNALSHAELIAILINSGNKEESAVALSKRILASVALNLTELGKLSVKDLMRFKGIGEAKAISIIAALELGRRRRGEEAIEKKQVTSSSSVFELMQPIIGELSHETFCLERVTDITGFTQRDDDNGLIFNFCKTARKPYDIAVCSALIIAKKHFGESIMISSDGDNEEWQESKALCQEILGYGDDLNMNYSTPMGEFSGDIHQ